MENIDSLANLFNEYRVFYGKESDRAAARAFLEDRFHNGDSIILIAEVGGAAAGFAQMYPSFSSVGMRRTFILNDLFVSPDFRRKKVGAMLLAEATNIGKQRGALRLTLTTDRENAAAQALYRNYGWGLDEVHRVFHFALE